jgi:2-dehydropantoate 2-reductase
VTGTRVFFKTARGVDMKIASSAPAPSAAYVGAKAGAGRRGRHLHRARRQPAAIRKKRHASSSADGTEQVARNVKATDDYAEAGPQDLVILAMKAHQVEAVANACPSCSGPTPWW